MWHGYNTVMSYSAEVVARAFVDAINRQDVEGLAGMIKAGNREQGLGNSRSSMHRSLVWNPESVRIPA
jgi:hypothetical protein